MGDTGSLFLGFNCATLILLMAEVDSRWLLAALVMFALPVLDTSLAFARRWVNRRPVFSADRMHFHHQLVQTAAYKSSGVDPFVICKLYTRYPVEILTGDSNIFTGPRIRRKTRNGYNHLKVQHGFADNISLWSFERYKPTFRGLRHQHCDQLRCVLDKGSFFNCCAGKLDRCDLVEVSANEPECVAMHGTGRSKAQEYNLVG